MLAGVEGEVADPRHVGGKFGDRHQRGEIRHEQVGPAFRLAAESKELICGQLVAMWSNYQGHRPPLDVDVGIEDVAGDRCRFARGMTLVVGDGDRSDDARKNLAHENLFDGGNVVVGPFASIAVFGNPRQAAAPAIEPTAGGLPIAGQRLVHRCGVGVDELLGVDRDNGRKVG